MNSYPVNHECPKCGCINLNVKYILAQYDVILGFEAPESLRWDCGKCSYFWFTKTKDSKED